MGFRHAPHLIVIISIVVYMANSDSTSFLSGDDLLFADTGLSSNSNNALAFNQPDSSLDLFSSSSSNVLQLPLEDTTNSDIFSDDSDPFSINNADLDNLGDNDLFSIPNTVGLDDGSVEMAACSSSSNDFPTIGKSRIRRQNPSVCTDPQHTGSFKSQDTPADTDVGGQSPKENPGLRALHTVLTPKRYMEQKNEQCLKHTAGVFPWGVCYQPTDVPPEAVGDSLVFPQAYLTPEPDPKGTLMQLFIVNPCSLCKSQSIIWSNNACGRFFFFFFNNLVCVCA